jgi:AcrR family transcriptional regulator
MRNASEDQRVYKTQMLIRNELCELMRTRSANEISVRELTEKIHISRGTFYLHPEFSGFYSIQAKRYNVIK